MIYMHVTFCPLCQRPRNLGLRWEMCPCSVTEFSLALWENLRMTSSNCRFHTFLCLGANQASFVIHNDGLYNLWNKRDNSQIDTFRLRRHRAKLRVSKVNTPWILGTRERRLPTLRPTSHFVSGAARIFGLKERFWVSATPWLAFV